jgi:hypothetical protein
MDMHRVAPAASAIKDQQCWAHGADLQTDLCDPGQAKVRLGAPFDAA